MTETRTTMPHKCYTIQEVASIVKGEFTHRGIETCITELLVDSRQLLHPKETLFFAIKTNKGNGHKYILELYNKGVRNFIVTEIHTLNLSLLAEANIIQLANSLSALQKLASHHRKQFTYPVIGITGSNGKTIVKEWLYHVLEKSYSIIRSPKSYNSQIGVPLSVWQMTDDYNLAIFEAGISEVGEMDKLREIIHPEIGIFTNIGEAHSDGFISQPQKAGEKMGLFTQVKTLIYSSDYGKISNAIGRSGLQKRIKILDWSRKNEAVIKILQVKKKEKYTSITAIYLENKITIDIPYLDEASIENSIQVLSVALLLGIKNELIISRMKGLPPIAMRLEMKEGINHCMIINDSYNSDTKSITIALDFLNQQFSKKDKTLILSDILQSRESEYELYQYIAGLISEKDIKRIIGIGPALTRQQKSFTDISVSSFYQSTDEFLTDFNASEYRDEGILIKGSRIFEFERISKVLQQKAHQTVLEINLHSLIENLNYFRSKLLPDTKIMVMVKAFSYGSGSFEIANILEYHNVDYLCVAYTDEGVELRRAGIKLPIIVMNPEEEAFDQILQYNLEPEIYSFRILKQFNKAIDGYSHDIKGKIHLKLDTGMHRLGFLEKDMGNLIKELQQSHRLRVVSVFSHLAAADDPQEDQFTRNQYQQLNAMATHLETALNYTFLKHILNSAGISRFPEAQMDMVRLGIGLYGVEHLEEEKGKLQNVSSLKTIISQIKEVPKGETVGYNRSFKAPEKMRIAIVPVGYADGLRRNLSNGKGRLYIHGKAAPIIGKICMDMCMLDIRNISCKEGDQVIIFGENHPITELAKHAETIPYEILTGISKRVKRVYFQE